MFTMGKRPIEDTMAALVCHGAFTRFPTLRVAAVENGGDWVVPFLHHMADVHRKMPQAFDEDPIEAFKRNVWISPFHEDDIGGLIDAVGADHILFGSDYPHPEGLAEPRSYLEHLPSGLPDDVIAGIMGGNLADIMRVDTGALAPA
jgi:predicted TIM-barrel fold metal-dependent hydrolase